MRTSTVTEPKHGVFLCLLIFLAGSLSCWAVDHGSKGASADAFHQVVYLTGKELNVCSATVISSEPLVVVTALHCLSDYSKGDLYGQFKDALGTEYTFNSKKVYLSERHHNSQGLKKLKKIKEKIESLKMEAEVLKMEMSLATPLFFEEEKSPEEKEQVQEVVLSIAKNIFLNQLAVQQEQLKRNSMFVGLSPNFDFAIIEFETSQEWTRAPKLPVAVIATEAPEYSDTIITVGFGLDSLESEAQLERQLTAQTCTRFENDPDISTACYMRFNYDYYRLIRTSRDRHQEAIEISEFIRSLTKNEFLPLPLEDLELAEFRKDDRGFNFHNHLDYEALVPRNHRSVLYGDSGGALFTKKGQLAGVTTLFEYNFEQKPLLVGKRPNALKVLLSPVLGPPPATYVDQPVVNRYANLTAPWIQLFLRRLSVENGWDLQFAPLL